MIDFPDLKLMRPGGKREWYARKTKLTGLYGMFLSKKDKTRNVFEG